FQDELTVERYLKRSRWEDYKYTPPGPYVDETTFRQLACADIETIRFQMYVPDEVAKEWAEHLAELKSSIFRVVFARCRMSVQALITLLTALRPKQVSVEFGNDWEEVSVDKLCLHKVFKEISHLSLINSRLSDDDLRLLNAQYLTVYEATGITVSGLHQILLDWYNGKRSITDYHLSVSDMIVPERLFDGLPTRRRSVIAWEVRNSDTILHVSIVGPGVSITKVYDVLVTD
ncbi:hypothetical protein OESDEN_22128, partial [Oesophagostomum dentatum]